MGIFGKKKIDAPVPEVVRIAPTPFVSQTPVITDYSLYSVPDLMTIKNAVEAEFQKRKEEVYGKVTDELETFGLSIDDVKAPVKKKRNVTIKYRDPASPENVWTGVGKPKKWLQEYIDAGRDKDEFLVPAE